MEQTQTQSPERIVAETFEDATEQTAYRLDADNSVVADILTAEIAGFIEHNPVVEWSLEDEELHEADDAYVIHTDYYGRYDNIEDSPYTDDDLHEDALRSASIVHDAYANSHDLGNGYVMVTVVPKATIPDDYNVETGEFEE